MRSLLIALTLFVFSFPQAIWAGEKKDQAAIVGAEITAFANQLSLRPQTAIDFSSVSGEYCFNLGLGKGANMTHYAIDPSKSVEDVIDFVNAEPLLKAGVNLDGLPKFPGKLGSMKPNQWYFLPARMFEPHHGKKFPMAMMVRASNVK